MGLEQHRKEATEGIGCAVLTFSDTRTEQDDRGGAFLVETLQGAGHRVRLRRIVREDDDAIEGAVREAVATAGVELVLTTGGTGIAPRDRTFPVLRRILDEEIPGFGELFRWLSHSEIGSAAILSRAIGGTLEGRVILALPGSVGALRLAMERIILPEAGHLVSELRRR